MDNKTEKYLDRVLDHLVRNTEIENYLWNPTLRVIDKPIPIFARCSGRFLGLYVTIV